jgi:predicted dehydrogenase
MQQKSTALPIFKNLAPNERIEKSISVALVGYGRQGELIIDTLPRIPGVHIAAIADIWPWRRELAKNRLRALRISPNLYETLDEMLHAEGNKIDAVIIATPDWQHFNHVSACLKANKHVYCDGEISDSSVKAQELVKLAGEKKLRVQCGHQRRSNPRYLYAIETLHRKYRIPDVVTHVYTQWHRGVTPLIHVPNRFAMSTADLQRHGYENMEQLLNWEWFNRFGLGDVAYRTGQKLDVLRWFWDAEPVSVTSLGSNDYYNRDAMDFLMSIFTFKLPTGEVRRGYVQVLSTNSRGGEYELFSGLKTSDVNCGKMRIVQVWCTCCGNSLMKPEEGFTVIGDYGDVLLRERILRAADDNILLPEKEPPDRTENYACHRSSHGKYYLNIPAENCNPLNLPHFENFISAIRDGTKLRDPIEQAAKNLIALEAAVQSARERRTIDLV